MSGLKNRRGRAVGEPSPRQPRARINPWGSSSQACPGGPCWTYPLFPPFQFSKDVLVNIYSAYIDNFLNAKDAVRIAKEARPAFMKFLEVGPGSSLPIGAGQGPESLAKLLVGQGGVNGSKLVTYGQTGSFHPSLPLLLGFIAKRLGWGEPESRRMV